MLQSKGYTYEDIDSNATQVAAFTLLLTGIVSFVGMLIKAPLI